MLNDNFFVSDQCCDCVFLFPHLVLVWRCRKAVESWTATRFAVLVMASPSLALPCVAPHGSSTRQRMSTLTSLSRARYEPFSLCHQGTHTFHFLPKCCVLCSEMGCELDLCAGDAFGQLAHVVVLMSVRCAVLSSTLANVCALRSAICLFLYLLVVFVSCSRKTPLAGHM